MSDRALGEIRAGLPDDAGQRGGEPRSADRRLSAGVFNGAAGRNIGLVVEEPSTITLTTIEKPGNRDSGKISATLTILCGW